MRLTDRRGRYLAGGDAMGRRRDLYRKLRRPGRDRRACVS